MPYEEDKLDSSFQHKLKQFYLESDYCLDCRPHAVYCPKHAELYVIITEEKWN